MKVASVKAVYDLRTWRAREDRLTANCPLAHDGPLIERQPCRGGIPMTPLHFGTARRREMIGTLVSNIRLGRSQVLPIRRCFHASGIDPDQILIARGGARF